MKLEQQVEEIIRRKATPGDYNTALMCYNHLLETNTRLQKVIIDLTNVVQEGVVVQEQHLKEIKNLTSAITETKPPQFFIDYGTNNPEAYKALCGISGVKHTWKFDTQLGRCYRRYVCSLCGSIVREDSSD